MANRGYARRASITFMNIVGLIWPNIMVRDGVHYVEANIFRLKMSNEPLFPLLEKVESKTIKKSGVKNVVNLYK
jgi:hypothetical protein